jgi:hypothetical protein
VGWTNLLSCVSCHDPHNRAGNFRLLRAEFNDREGTQAVRVRGVSEADPATGRAASRYFSGIVYFCTGCHRAFSSPAAWTARPSDAGVDTQAGASLLSAVYGEEIVATSVYFRIPRDDCQRTAMAWGDPQRRTILAARFSGSLPGGTATLYALTPTGWSQVASRNGPATFDQ